MVAGCCVIGVPLALLGHQYYDRMGAIGGWALGALISGFPVDKYLEDRFGRLTEITSKTRDKETTEEQETPAAGAGAD